MLTVTVFHLTCTFCAHDTGQHCSSMYTCTYRMFIVRGAPWWVFLQHSIMLRLIFIVDCGTTCFLSMLYMYTKCGQWHHPHP